MQPWIFVFLSQRVNLFLPGQKYSEQKQDREKKCISLSLPTLPDPFYVLESRSAAAAASPPPSALYLCLPACFQGDAILQCEHIFETVTKLCMLANKQDVVKVVQGR